MASPRKPWEDAGSAGTTTSAIPTTSSSPPIPARPTSLAAAANSTAAAYSRMGGVGVGGVSGMSAYSSPYSRFGAGGYGASPYGGYGTGYGTGYGSYSGSYGYGAGGYGSGAYGPGPYDPNNPSAAARFGQSTATTFQMLEGIVGAFSGFAQMLESTYMATHSSFHAMVSVAEQFGNLRDALGSIFGIFALLRWLKNTFARLTGRPMPTDAASITPAAFASFEARGPRASRKPLFFFLLAAFGIPYLLKRAISALATKEQPMAAVEPAIDPTRLDYCRVLYDFPAAVAGVDLQVAKDDIVAVLGKTDPLGNASDWWRCRARDGRMGYVPSAYLRVVRQALPAAPDASSTSSLPAPASSTPDAAPLPLLEAPPAPAPSPLLPLFAKPVQNNYALA